VKRSAQDFEDYHHGRALPRVPEILPHAMMLGTSYYFAGSSNLNSDEGAGSRSSQIHQTIIPERSSFTVDGATLSIAVMSRSRLTGAGLRYFRRRCDPSEYFPVWYREHALPNHKPVIYGKSLEALNSEHNIGSMRFGLPASDRGSTLAQRQS
jgi:hypothetical protein